MEVSATPMDYLNETMQMDVFLAPLTDIEAHMEFLNTVMYAKDEDRDAREEAEYEYHHKRGHNLFDIEDIISLDILTTRPKKPLPKRVKAKELSVSGDDDQATGITDGLKRLAILEESTTQASPNADGVRECDAAAASATQSQVQPSGDALELSTDAHVHSLGPLLFYTDLLLYRNDSEPQSQVSLEPIGNADENWATGLVPRENSSSKSEEDGKPNYDVTDGQTETLSEEGDVTAVGTTAQTATSSQLPDLVTSSLLAQLSAQAQDIIARNGGGNDSPDLSQSDIAILRKLELHLARITAGNTSSSPLAEPAQPGMAQQGHPPLVITTYSTAPHIATSKAGYPIPPAIWPPICSFGAVAMAPPQPADMATVLPPIAYMYGPFAPYGLIL
ncbi:hypothetical protein FA13DRAFT_1820569 [Coprinellus micaceus]|uniref:Uncharacterized protein n=1 Tax=Coprinellus micaceus TaxID=71717 RepID=A0A4Y7SDS1_COPMI|nr:hypothetical protein FA13DRAFT_1820569 [Coprinellus micaceus]